MPTKRVKKEGQSLPEMPALAEGFDKINKLERMGKRVPYSHPPFPTLTKYKTPPP
jgi:hypothetical protein